MTIAVVDRPVTAGQYSAPSAITPVSLRPLDQANQRLENKYGDEVERISRSMRSAEPMVRMESPRSVDQKSNRLRMPATRAQRSDQCNGSGLPYGAGALDAHRAGTTCGACLPRLAELTAETLWQTVYCLEVIDRAPAVMTPQQRRLAGYGLLFALAAFFVQALLGIKWPLFDRLQATTAYSALTGSGLLVLLMLQMAPGLPAFAQRRSEVGASLRSSYRDRARSSG